MSVANEVDANIEWMSGELGSTCKVFSVTVNSIYSREIWVSMRLVEQEN